MRAASIAAFERVRERSAGVENEVLAEQDGSADDGEFARAVGCSVEELLKLADANAYLFVEYGGRRYWPRWQSYQGAPLPGIAAVLEALSRRRLTGFSAVLFFLTRTDALHLANVDPDLDVLVDDCPLALLRRSGVQALPLVLEHAQRWPTHGAR